MTRWMMLSCMLALGCAHASHDYLKPKQLERLTDGVFAGEIDDGLLKAKVEVTVADGKIAAVKIIDVMAFAWRHAAVTGAFPGRVVEAQGLEIDAVSGATGSWEALRIATDRALARSVEQD